MSQNIEIEYKNLLTKEEFSSLQKELFSSVEPIKQTNYYFETEDLFLKHMNSSLRIREKQNKWVITLKEPTDVGILETHQSLFEQQFHELLSQPAKIKMYKPIAEQLQAFNFPFKDLKYYGKLVTFRQTIYRNNDIIIVLDRSIYNNQEDFELEVEGTDKNITKEAFLNILDNFMIDQRQAVPKIARFFTTI